MYKTIITSPIQSDVEADAILNTSMDFVLQIETTICKKYEVAIS
jgi:hypothetical protein